jgi:hypothetical protein
MLDPSLFDKILLHKDVKPYIVANTYLHILDQRRELFEKYNLSAKERILQSIRFKLVILVRVFQTIFYKKYSTKQKNIKSNVLFVSHLTNSQQLFQDHDAYFGDLPNQLFQHGEDSTIVLINHIKANNHKISSLWKGTKVNRLILNLSLDFFSEIKLYFAQRKSKQRLNSILKELKIDKIETKNILNNQFSANTFAALRIAKQVTDIAEKTGAKFIITTYEGHAWERLVYYYARKLNPSIKCFGFQHAAVFENQHAIKRSLGSLYNPDIIFTSGKISQRILKECKLLRNLKIICLGSPKHINPNAITDKVDCCLVVPEGSVQECLYLFELSYFYAIQNKNQKFIWRLHPLLSFEKIKKFSAIFKNLPKNISLSNGDFDEDVQKSDSVLYRGSTAVINAINAGLRPIYYQQSIDEISIDPIYQLIKGKEFVSNQKQLKLAFNEDIDSETRQSLQDFAQDFYSPLDVQVLKQVII